jgi:hypothetical protein
MQSVMLRTNYSNIYGDSVLYKCVYDHSTSIATLNNGDFNCTLEKSRFGSYSINVSILIESNLKKTSLPFSKNFETFFFLSLIYFNLIPQDSIESLFISPTTETFTDTNLKKRNIKIHLKDDLITSKNIYCKFTSNDGVGFSKASFVDYGNKNITCDIEKQNFLNNIEIIDVVLIVNASEPFVFELSSNNQSFMFVKNEITWISKKVIDTTSLSSTLNIAIPSKSQFKYQMRMIADSNNSNYVNVDCSYNFASNPICNLPKDYLTSLNFIPTKLKFQLAVSHVYSLESILVNVDFLTFYKKIEFQHMKPFYMSYIERLNYPLRIIGNTLTSLNSTDYQFICNITQNGTNFILVNATFDLKENEFQPNLEKNSHFVCTFNSFGLKNQDYEISLGFISSEGIKIFTLNTSKVFTNEKGLNLQQFYGSNKGGYEIGSIPFDMKYPTMKYSNYSHSLKFQDRNLEIPIESQFTSSGFTFTMIDISEYFKTWDVVERSMKLNLYINNIRSISFNPFFTFYRKLLQSDNKKSPLNLCLQLYFSKKILEHH